MNGWSPEPTFWKLFYAPPNVGDLVVRDGAPVCALAPPAEWEPPGFTSVPSGAEVPLDYADVVTSAPFCPGSHGKGIPDLVNMKRDVPQELKELLIAFKMGKLRGHILSRFYDHVAQE